MVATPWHLVLRTVLVLGALLMLASCGRSEQRMPIFVVPFYDSDGLKINVGALSRGLAAPDAAGLRGLLSQMRARRNELNVETMYVAAIRAYDLGLKDEAAYWFYSAQYRAMLFQKLLDQSKVGGLGHRPFELQHAFRAFQQLAGEYINGHSFGDPGKLAGIIATVKAEGQHLPPLQAIYPDIAFINEAGWAEVNEGVNAGLGELIAYLSTNGDEIRAQRRANGIEGKY